MVSRSDFEVPNVRVPATFGQLYDAWQKARKRKKPSASRWRFQRHWLDSLVYLADILNAGRWRRPRCLRTNALTVRLTGVASPWAT